MTTLNGSEHGAGYRGVDELLAKIGQVRLRRWWFRVLACLGGAVAIWSVALLFATMLGYWPGQPPAPLRWGLFALLIVLGLGLLGWLGERLLRGRLNPIQTARFIEQALPEVRNDLINAVLLSQDKQQPSPQLVQCAIDECRFRLNQRDLAMSCTQMRKKMVAWLLAGAVSLGALLGFALLEPGPFGRGIIAALQPAKYVPVDNFLTLVSLSPGDTEVFPGQPVTFSIAVRNEDPNRDIGKLQAEVVLANETDPRPMFAAPLQNTDSRKFETSLEAVHHTLRYFIRIRSDGRENRWPADRPWFEVATEDFRVESFTASYRYPLYTGLAERIENLDPADGTIQAPLGSIVTMTVELATAMPAGYIEFSTGPRQAMQSREGNRIFEFAFPVKESGGYRLLFADQAGRILSQLPSQAHADSPPGLAGYYAIIAQADKSPDIRFIEPNRDVAIPAGGELKLKIQARDDFGLANIQLWASSKGQTPSRVENFKVSDLADKKETLATYNWKLAGVEGNEIFYYATARDNRNLKSLGGAQTSATPKFRITIRNATQLLAQQADMLSQLQKQLLTILQQQTHQRVNTEMARLAKTIKQTNSVGLEIHAGQTSILQGLQKVTRLLEADALPLDRELENIKEIVLALTANDAPTAIDQAHVLACLAELGEIQNACITLGDTQDGIIRVLQELLAILPSQAGQLEQAKEQAGSDLTADQRRAKREQLAEDMQKFIAEQKKIIQAGQRLTKTPVDDFTAADKKLLLELAGLEDKWEKFLNETFADFSKLAEQDFSTPSMLKELLAVKCDITMARDALQKQAVEIATAAEESAVENAETLTANLEKWLPDEPDRKKWDMEALEEQQNTEQAELASELEDMVGDLLEDEEDLFDEMDDITSKSTTSGDKGIGWDAMDGPISSMNAQGVTGNQLPNTSEVSGRSGEGRTGKSAGEFVEDKAVGKGGRRTPTRLSKDPFQKGQINDVSTDPPGGATGGGKLSGAGAEGLEGPTPAKLGKELERLAGKQAEIVNRAERISANFKPGDYSTFQMQQAILLMNRVKNDLTQKRYKNALRHRHATLAAMNKTRQLLTQGREIDVAEDTSQAMPKYIRDNINNSMQGKQPAEYREVLQQYYRRLSEAGKATND